MSWLLAVFWLLFSTSPAYSYQQKIPDMLERYHRILQQAYANSSEEMEYARKSGAMFTPMAGGDGLYLAWAPPNATRLLVVLPGGSSDAWKAFRFWHPAVKDRGIALLIPQWQSGPMDILQTSPQSLYAITLQSAFIRKGYAKGSGLLYAPKDRGAFAYSIAEIDRRAGNGNHIGTFILEDAPADFNDPAVQQINTRADRQFFENSRWLLACSTSCEAMNKTAAWLLFNGARAEQFTQKEAALEAALPPPTPPQTPSAVSIAVEPPAAQPVVAKTVAAKGSSFVKKRRYHGPQPNTPFCRDAMFSAV